MVSGLALLLLAAGCGGGGDGAGSGNPDPVPPANASPVANAGAAQSVASGASVVLNGTASSDSDGSIATYAWTQTAGAAVSLSSNASAQPSFTAPQVAVLSTLTFSLVVTDNRGASSAATSVTITVNPPPAGNVTLSGTVRFARVPIRTTAPLGLDHANPVLRPARGVLVRVVDATNPATVLASGNTDSAGGYAFTVPANTNVLLQVVARMQRDASQPLPRWDVRVQDGVAAAAPYTYTSAAFGSSTGTLDIDIPTNLSANGLTALGTRYSGAFAILDTLYTAMQAVIGVAPAADFPAFYVDWGPTADGTYFTTANGQHITLRGDLSEDTEEFDQHVVAHEFGHYIERNFSRSDSIGGSHTLGDRLDPRVAFGEGFGYAFGAIVLNDPQSLDSFVDNGVQRLSGFNVETNPVATACWCSESSVWAILWDLYDSANEGNDSLSLGLQPLWDVLIGTAHRNTPAVTSLFSFISALKAARPGDAAAVNAVVAAQNINAAAIDPFGTNETWVPPEVPSLAAIPVFTTITPGVPVVLRTVDDAGHYNKLGNRRFLRFTAASSGSATITLATSNPNPSPDPDFLVRRSGTLVAVGLDPPSAQPEAKTFAVVAGATYVIDAYDCANGCAPDPDTGDLQGIQGDYDLTVTLTIH